MEIRHLTEFLVMYEGKQRERERGRQISSPKERTKLFLQIGEEKILLVQFIKIIFIFRVCDFHMHL